MGSDQLFHKNKMRKNVELSRRKEQRSARETIAIFCEDSKSVPYYLNQIIQKFRLSNVRIMPSDGSAPINVVDQAIAYAKSTPEIDRVVCIFDRDQHESYQRAKEKCEQYSQKKRKKLMLITSTPCFEFWLLLHFGYTTKPFQSDSALQEIKRNIPNYDKGTRCWYDALGEKHAAAIQNGKKLAQHNVATGSANPDTNMHELIEYLIQLKLK